MLVADALTRDRVLDVALAIVESEGVDGLTMRALATKLGVAVTSIYWHVGNKDALLAAMVDRIGDEVGRVRVAGRTPERRVLSVARSLRRNLDARRDLVAVAHAQGRAAVVFVPTRQALADAFAEAGLAGARLSSAVDAVVHLVVGSVLIERATDRAPVHFDDGDAHPPPEQVFEVTLPALVRGLLSPA